MEKIKRLRPKPRKEKFEIGKLNGKYVIKKSRTGVIVCKFQLKDQEMFDVKRWLDFFSGVYG